MEAQTLQSVLSKIQKSLDVPKNQHNEFGGYNYRSAEDILEAVKKLLPDGCFVQCQDDIVLIGERYYVKATAYLIQDDKMITNVAFAREEDSKKGMDGSQVTGAASSYARKYALNGLFAIDDVKDADTMDNRQPARKMAPRPATTRPVTQRPSTAARPAQTNIACPEHGDPVNSYGGHRMPDGSWCNAAKPLVDAARKSGTSYKAPAPAATPAPAPVVNNDPNVEIN